MRKIIRLAVVIALLSFAGSAFGAVAIDDINGYVGEATNITFDGQEVSFDGSKVTVLASGHKEGVTDVVTGSVTDLYGTRFLSYGVIHLEDHGTGVIDRSIAIGDGTPGQMITILLKASTGTFTLYITDDQVAPGVVTKTGWDDIALGTALDQVTLLYVDDTIGWIVIGQYGAVVT